MDWQEFVASLASSLAWPAAVVAIAVVFRREFQALLRRLKSGKFRSTEFEFAETLESVEDKRMLAEGAEVVQEIQSPEASDRFEGLRELRSGYFDDRYADLARDAERNPSFAILSAWELMHLSYHRLIRVAGREDEPGRRPLPFSAHLRPLVNGGILSQHLVDVYKQLRDLRNLVAHGSEGPSSGNAVAYVGLADWFSEKLREAARRVEETG